MGTPEPINELFSLIRAAPIVHEIRNGACCRNTRLPMNSIGLNSDVNRQVAAFRPTRVGCLVATEATRRKHAPHKQHRLPLHTKKTRGLRKVLLVQGISASLTSHPAIVMTVKPMPTGLKATMTAEKFSDAHFSISASTAEPSTAIFHVEILPASTNAIGNFEYVRGVADSLNSMTLDIDGTSAEVKLNAVIFACWAESPLGSPVFALDGPDAFGESSKWSGNAFDNSAYELSSGPADQRTTYSSLLVGCV